MRCSWLGFSIFLIASGAPRDARADPSAPVHLQYDAPEECPTEGAFLAQVQARTARMRVAGEGEPALSLRVELVRRDARVFGVLVVTDLDGAESRREVDGDACDAVVAALALVAALRIDPDASTRALSQAATPLMETPSPEVTFAPPKTAPAWIPLQPAPRAEPRPPPRSPAPPPPSRKIHFSGAVGLDVLGLSGAVLGATVLAEVEFDRPGVLAPEVRLGASRTETRTLTASDGSGTGDFTWTRALLELCPLRFALAPGLDVRPCVTGALGGLHAEGHGVTASNPPETPLWLEVGGAASVTWRIVGPLRLEADGGFSLPLSRPTFYFATPGNAAGSVLYSTPAVAGEGRLGLAVRFL